MSVELVSKNGPLGQIATNLGWEETSKWVAAQATGSELQSFFRRGKTVRPQKVAKLARRFAETFQPASEVASVLNNLAQLLEKAEDFAVAE
jgi:hypothetical protein